MKLASTLLHRIPIFIQYLTKTEFMISRCPVASKFVLMIPSNFLCIGSYP